MDIRNYPPLVLLFIWCCTICVAEPPVITRGLSNQTLVDGSDFSLLCEATGDPPLKFDWKKMDKRISAIRYIEEEPVTYGDVTASVLRIEPLKRRRDSEEFTCTVSNNDGEVSSSGSLQVLQERDLADGFPEILQDPDIAVAENGRRARMICEAEGNPAPDVSWYKDYQLLNVDGNRLQLQDGTLNLLIDPANSADQGRYHCAVNNTHGVRYSLPAFLYIREPSVSPPEWDIVPTPGPISLGSSKDFTCSASGNPVPIVQWYEGSTPTGQPVASGLGTSILTVDNIQTDLTYNCYAYNDYGTIGTTIQIQPVESGPDNGQGEPPEFTYEPTNTQLERGGDTFLLCSARGVPVPDIRWLNRGLVLDQSEPDAGYSYLSIRDFQATDSFTCHAYNPHGEIFRSVTVTLTEDGGGPGTGTEPPPLVTTALLTTPSQTTLLATTTEGVTPPSGISSPPGGNGGGDGVQLETGKVESDSVLLRWSSVPDAGSYVVEYRTAEGPYEYLTQTTGNEYLVENLQPSTDYLFRVSYVDQNGARDAGTELVVRTAEDTPDAFPQDLRAVAIPPTNGDAPAVQFFFTSPDTSEVITGYNVYYTDDPTQPFSSWGKMTVPATGEPEITGVIRNLYPDTTYYLSSTVLNAAGEGPASFLAVVQTGSGGQPTRPNPPEAPIVRDVTSSSVTLIFTPAPDINSFILEYQESNLLPDFNAIPGIVETEYTVGNLKPNTDYTFRVSGENDQGPSGPSRETTVTTSGGTDLLPPPSQPEIDALSATSVALRWQPGSADPVDYYILEYFRTDTGATQSVDVDGTTYIVDRLEPYTDYVFRVYPVNSAGKGESSQETRVTTSEFPPGSPPEGLIATPISSSEIQLQWEPPTIPFGVIRGYTVYYTPSPPPPTVDDWSVVTTSQPQLQLTDLEPNQLYNFRVRAFNSVGDGPASLTVIAQTPSPAVDVPPPPTNIQGQAVSPTSVRLQWEPSAGDPVTSYIVEYNLPFPEDSIVRRIEVPTNSVTIDDLQPNSEYAFRVRATNAAGPGELSPAVVIQTPEEGIPLPPSTPRPVEVTDSSITVSWTPGSPDTVYYLLQYMNTATQEADALEVYDTSYTLSGLELGSEYVIRVFGLNSQGAGSPSDIITVTTGDVVQPPSGVPAAPRNLQGQSVSDSSVSLNWVPGDSVPVDRYYIRWSNVVDAGDAGDGFSYDNNYIATDLQPGATYAFNVAAENTDGLSPYSERVDVTVRQGQVTLPAPSIPEVIETTPDSIAFFWQPGSDDQVYYYTIQYVRTDTGESQTIDTQDTSYTLTNLEPDTEYSIRVFPYNQAGRGEVSETRLVRTQPIDVAPPPAPSRPEFREVTSNSVTLTWESEGDVAYYVVQYERPDLGEVYSDVVYHNEWTVVSLEPDTYYTFEVSAVNRHGTSEPSEQAAVVTLGIPDTPERLDTPEILQSSSDSMTVRWEPSTASYLDYYILEYWQSDDFEGTYQFIELRNLVDTTYTVMDLESDAGYGFRVSAVNIFGRGEPSYPAYGSTRSAIGTPEPPTVEPPTEEPSITEAPIELKGPEMAPSGVEVDLVCSDTALVYWEPPASNDTITGYNIYYFTNEFDVQNVTVNGNKRFAVLKGLKGGSTYNITVSALNQDGEGPESDDVSVETEVSVPDVSIHDIVAEFVTSNETNEIQLSWRYGDVQIVYSDSVTGEEFNTTISRTERYTVIPDVMFGTTYRIELVSGSSSYVVSVVTGEDIRTTKEPEKIVTRAPPARETYIKEVEAFAVDDNTVRVKWYPMKETNGVDILGYAVQYGVVPEPGLESLNNTEGRIPVSASEVAYDVEGLSEGVTYEIIVFAETSEGPGAGSDPVYIKVDKDAVASDKLDSQFAKTAFDYYLAQLLGRQVPDPANATEDESSVLVDLILTLQKGPIPPGLDEPADQFIEYSLQFVTLPTVTTTAAMEILDEGTSPQPIGGEEMGSGMPQAPTSPVKEVSHRAIDDQTIRLKWFPPKDTMDDIKSYIISYQPVDKDYNPVKDSTSVRVESTVLEYDLKDLESNTLYEIIVYTSNSEGDGPGSAPIYVMLSEDVKNGNLPPP